MDVVADFENAQILVLFCLYIRKYTVQYVNCNGYDINILYLCLTYSRNFLRLL